jgi:hypothetical protein
MHRGLTQITAITGASNKVAASPVTEVARPWPWTTAPAAIMTNPDMA